MDKYVKQSIDARKDAIFAAYQVGDEGKKKVEKLFSEIEKFGADCKDVGDFEAKFAASPLNQKYLDLFTELATISTPAKAAAAPKVKVGGIVASNIAGGVVENAATRAKNAVLPTRAAVNQTAYDAARKIPGVGDAIDIKEKAGYAMHLKGLFRKKKEK